MAKLKATRKPRTCGQCGAAINKPENREQLMEDIDCIVESFFADTWGDEYQSDRDKLTRTLCDAVCANFPLINNNTNSCRCTAPA
tara:strand:- start:190 stop:444 length:255 start_codon:yes stop_codon:yes gene_type:complete